MSRKGSWCFRADYVTVQCERGLRFGCLKPTFVYILYFLAFFLWDSRQFFLFHIIYLARYFRLNERDYVGGTVTFIAEWYDKVSTLYVADSIAHILPTYRFQIEKNITICSYLNNESRRTNYCMVTGIMQNNYAAAEMLCVSIIAAPF